MRIADILMRPKSLFLVINGPEIFLRLIEIQLLIETVGAVISGRIVKW